MGGRQLSKTVLKKNLCIPAEGKATRCLSGGCTKSYNVGKALMVSCRNIMKKTEALF